MGDAMSRLFGRPAGARRPYAQLGGEGGGDAGGLSADALDRTIMHLDKQLAQLEMHVVHCQTHRDAVRLTLNKCRRRGIDPPAATVAQYRAYGEQLDRIEGQRLQATKARIAIESVLMFREQKKTLIEVTAQLARLNSEVTLADLVKLAGEYETHVEHLNQVNDEMMHVAAAAVGVGTLSTGAALGADGILTAEDLATLDELPDDGNDPDSVEEEEEVEVEAPRPAQRPPEPSRGRTLTPLLQ
jgi:hypothetical protein